MNWDYYSTLAEENCTMLEDNIQKLEKLEKEIIDEKDKNKKRQKESEAENLRKDLLHVDPHLSYHCLAVKKKEFANIFRSIWQKENIQNELDTTLIDSILTPSSIDISSLPAFSFSIQFTFTLEKPYISRDEQEFYIIDNPIRKDRVFGIPYIAPSSWKGSLKAALWQLNHKAEDEEIRRIFGNERKVKEHERLRAGRLHLFPTFFTKKGLEIINPHDREKKVGKKPILFESVPESTSGIFTLLYVPFDLIGREEIEIKKHISIDILLIVKGLKAMFRDYGFGAKTSSGFGIAKPDLTNGKLILKAEGIQVSQKEEIRIHEPEEAFLKYLNEDDSVKEEFKGSGGAGLLSNTQYGKKDQLSGGSLGEFKKFRLWYADSGVQWQKHLQSVKTPGPEWPIWKFKSLDELLNVAEEIEKSLKSKGEMQ